MRRGQRRADRPENRCQPRGNKAAVQALLSVGFSTRLARDGSGVSALQHYTTHGRVAAATLP
jgi:hypothetical protein